MSFSAILIVCISVLVCSVDELVFEVLCESMKVHPILVHFMGTFLTSALTFWVHVFFFDCCYPSDPTYEKRNQRLWKKSFRTVLVNQFIFQTLAEFFFASVLNLGSDASVLNKMTKLVGCAFVTDFVFYGMHCLLHTSYFWFIHQKHHEITHPTPIATLYCHFLEHLFCNILSIVSGPLLFHLSPVLTWWWILLATSSSVTSHSSRTSNWLGSQIPFLHYIHHSNVSYLNRSISGFPDWLFGTSRST
jgi:sterol desaturase/sphingolipid hydroxylase (fatty acid hydroxylase superfamily)